MLVHNDVTISDATTGGIIRELTMDPTKEPPAQKNRAKKNTPVRRPGCYR